MGTARIFWSGHSQAVRLPKEFRFEGSEVEIFRRGEEVVLREKDGGMERALDVIAELPDDFLEELDDPPPSPRKGL